MNTSEILARAADLIEERGHCKGTGENEKGQLCAYGAIRKAAEVFVDADQYFGAAADRLTLHVGGPVSFWNDAAERTASDVTAALRGAAEAARAEH